MKSVQYINHNELSMPVAQAIQVALQYHQAGQLQQAESIYSKVLQADPDNPDSLFLLGAVSYQMKKHHLAIDLLKKALFIDPDYAEAHSCLASILREQRKFDEAILHYKKAVEIRPDCAEAHNNLGNVLREQGEMDEAIFHFKEASKIMPDLVDAHFNLGDVLHCIGHSNEAMGHYKKALAIKPDYAEAHNNLGTILVEEGRFMDALSHYKKTLQIKPDLALAHFNLALLLLMLGDFERGWKEYEWRWKAEDIVKQIFPYQRSYTQPLWDGSDVKGKTVLLYDEQGFGDTLQFIRYAPLVARAGAKVIVECQQGLKPLIKNVEGVHHVSGHGEELPEFDLRCPLVSLPLLFKTTIKTIPAKIPYLSADHLLGENWGNKLKLDNSKLKIGLVWAGRTEHKYNHNRSHSIEIFSPLLQLHDITFYSLQKGDAAKQIDNLPGNMTVIDYSDMLVDFFDTAALIQNLDLVISVDTAVAHLAGALGKPVWVLLPFIPDWRWLLNREDSPWYPTMRLFRQSATGKWDTVVSNILTELAELLEGDRTRLFLKRINNSSVLNQR